MAGLEQLEVLKQSYLIRWIEIRSGYTLNWSIQPSKRSINFGIFKPTSGNAPGNLNSSSIAVRSDVEDGNSNVRPALSRQISAASAVDDLKAQGYRVVHWQGTCEPGKITSGTVDVKAEEGGLFAIVLDNTSAKQHARTVNLVPLVSPTTSSKAMNNQLRVGIAHEPDKRRSAIPRERETSLSSGSSRTDPSAAVPSTAPQLPGPMLNNLQAGILWKRRRKKGQGFAKRWFTLDTSSATLSYCHDKSRSAIRGAISLRLAVVATDESRREFSVDSGLEVWRLKASTSKDFQSWKTALAQASQGPRIKAESEKDTFDVNFPITGSDGRHFTQLALLSEKLQAASDVARSLAKDTDPKYLRPQLHPASYKSGSDTNIPDGGRDQPIDEAADQNDRKPFWRRVSSRNRLPTSQLRRTSSNQGGSMNISTSMQASEESLPEQILKRSPVIVPIDESVHSRCLNLMADLDSMNTLLTTLLSANKPKSAAMQTLKNNFGKTSSSRASMDSTRSYEFFDADAGLTDSQLLTIQHDEDDDDDNEPTTWQETLSPDEDDDSSASEVDEPDDKSVTTDTRRQLFPRKPSPISIPSPPSSRRQAIPPAASPPPSLISFFRKNVGKDLSSISMPVASNEPISLLQKLAEPMEYSYLLDRALDQSSPVLRLVYVTSFAIASLSGMRVKERANRKPFNPLLSETFEYISPQSEVASGYRVLAEKVSHRPLKLAFLAESTNWSLQTVPSPSQKFWGKSAELITNGEMRLRLCNPVNGINEFYSWDPASCFLRNVLAGEKYVEPVATMRITNETSRDNALVTFKAGGMFSGRSEECTAEFRDSFDERSNLVLRGKWTSSLALGHVNQPTNLDEQIWSVGKLVKDPNNCYGFTEFTASLNAAPANASQICPTDSRLRPDQRNLENGKIDLAESQKTQLEDAQRKRRQELEQQEREHEPVWFENLGSIGGEEIWKIKEGKNSYWERRAKNDWTGVNRIFG